MVYVTWIEILIDLRYSHRAFSFLYTLTEHDPWNFWENVFSAEGCYHHI